MKPSLYLIINPTAGSFHKKAFKRAQDILKERFVVKEFYTEKRGDAEEMAKRLIEETPYAMVVVGGDGTFNEVINATAYTGIPLGFIPAGTSNVLAKELSLSEDMVEAAKRIVTGKEKVLHLGYVNKRFFALMTGVGFDGASVYNLNKNLKRVAGKVAYVISGLGVFIKKRPERLKIVVDDKEYEGTDVIVCNARKYAGNFTVCHRADMTKPFLDIFILNRSGRRELIKVLLGIIRGKELKFKYTMFLEGKKILIENNAHVQVDGDYFGKTPVEITIKEGAIKLII